MLSHFLSLQYFFLRFKKVLFATGMDTEAPTTLQTTTTAAADSTSSQQEIRHPQRYTRG